MDKGKNAATKNCQKKSFLDNRKKIVIGKKNGDQKKTFSKKGGEESYLFKKEVSYYMIITITGYPGSGKSTLGKGIAKELGLKHYSAGDFLRQISKERGMSLMQIQHEMKKDRKTDDELDKRTAELAKKEDDFVIDGRMAWHFVPKSIKVFVKVDLKKAAERVYKDTCRGTKERQGETCNVSVEETEANMRKRMQMNRQRYKKLYNQDFLDEKNYDIVVDTTTASSEETRAKALEEIRKLEGE